MDLECGPDPRAALDADVPPALLNDAEDGGEPEARSLSDRFGREEGLEDSIQGLGRHALAAVAHAEHDVTTRAHYNPPRRGRLVDVDLVHLDPNAAAPWHRIARVHDQVHENLRDLARGHLDVARPEVSLRRDLDRLAHDVVEGSRHAIDDGAHVHHLLLDGLVSAERQQLAGQLNR